MHDSRALLIAGDLLAFFAFGVIGLTSHEESITLKIVARSMVPFPVAWLVIAPWLGMFSRDAVAGRMPVYHLLLAWIAAGVVALIARAIIFDRELLNAFFVIALVGNALFLVAWRAAYGAWLAKRGSATAALR